MAKRKKEKQTTVKHVARKVTPEQVSAMNRELEVRGVGSWEYTINEDGRLTTQPIYGFW